MTNKRHKTPQEKLQKQKDYYKENREARLAYQKEYNESIPKSKKRDYKAKWFNEKYANDPDFREKQLKRVKDYNKKTGYSKKYYEEHKEMYKEAYKKWKMSLSPEEREKLKEYFVEYYQENKERLDEINKNWVEENRDRWNEYQAEYKRKNAVKYKDLPEEQKEKIRKKNRERYHDRKNNSDES